MSVVFQAEPLLVRPRVAVALKVALASTDAAARLADESRHLRRLSHPGVVRLFPALGAASRDRYLRSEGGFTYLVMELLRGETLHQRLLWRETLAWNESLTLLEQVAEALDHCHARGVLHCDVKPRNIVYREAPGWPNRRAVLVDFGVSRSTRRPSASRLAGTRPYLAPEQLRLAAGEAATVTPQTDLWSLAVVAYELLTGVRPLTDAPGAAHALPARAVEVFGRSFATTPADRHASCGAFVAELRAALAGADPPPATAPERARHVARIVGLRASTVAADLVARVVAAARSGEVGRGGVPTSGRRRLSWCSDAPGDATDATPLLVAASDATVSEGASGDAGPGPTARPPG
jgi:serine/threonine-protein kinase